jgi:hypothetical protein
MECQTAEPREPIINATPCVGETDLRIIRYLECEKLLHEFFSLIDFCYPNCLSQTNSLYPCGWPGKYGCCTTHYFQLKSADHLAKKIKKKYGQPNSGREYPCGYHTAEGCRLIDHKPPICIAYVCMQLAKQIEIQYGIEYFYDIMSKKLDFILNEFGAEKEFYQLKEKIRACIERVKKIKNLGQKKDSFDIISFCR